MVIFTRNICLPQYFCKRRFYNCRLISHKDDYFYNIFEKNLSYSLPKEVFGHPSFCSTNKYKYEFLNHLSSNSPYNKNLWNYEIFGKYLSSPDWIFIKENEHFIQNNSRLIFDNFSNTFIYDQYFSSEVSLIFLNFCYRNYICRNLSILLEFLDFSSRSLKFFS